MVHSITNWGNTPVLEWTSLMHSKVSSKLTRSRGHRVQLAFHLLGDGISEIGV